MQLRNSRHWLSDNNDNDDGGWKTARYVNPSIIPMHNWSTISTSKKVVYCNCDLNELKQEILINL